MSLARAILSLYNVDLSQIMRKQLLISSSVVLVLILLTIGVILYGMGYRFGFQQGRPDLSGTGLLVATSNPDGAQVFINGHLTTATDNTINLGPGSYNVKIFKEGYFPWEKTIVIKKEVVSKADARLFPTAPILESITNTGVLNPVLDLSETRIAYAVASQSARKNGIYVLDMTSRPIITLQSSSTQVADDTINTFSQAKLLWAPDSSALIATISSQPSQTVYLLKANVFNQNPTDVTETLQNIDLSWKKQLEDKQKARLDSLPLILRANIQSNFNILSWSPDDTKILYQASQSASLPIIINPRLIGTDSTSEERNIQKGSVYVYDVKEDRNYKILDTLSDSYDPTHPYLLWFPDSLHLIYTHNHSINIEEYDGQNSTTVYAGPFVDNLVFPWSDGSKIVIVTNLGNTSIGPNLYTIGLK
jgi:hypothetical protein